MSSPDPKDVPPDFDDAPLPTGEDGHGAPAGDAGWDDAPLPEDDGFSPLAAASGGWPGADEVPPGGPRGYDGAMGAGGHSGSRSGGGGSSSEGGARPPSEKQLGFARKLAAERGIELPADALASGPACSRFIDEALKQPPKGGAAGAAGSATSGGGARPATERQIAFAKKLAAERGVEIPKEALESGPACSRFIDAQLGKKPSEGPGAASSEGERPAAGPRPPSQRQLAFAKKLSAEKGMELTDADLADSRAISRFIDRALGKG